ncbi:gfo/Idh/MocA family oxidoreductase [Maribellus comscasis]|uniref:Gfo/Idh/MocA family oxidoreductase n=1 Tax=Maribellus comscasis TaxID=2681766 RepID=A0A6I6K2U4_9BACT|nr:Gfo/Idh/MocA family oxidoreductase [Maribellus comscasis]QGY47979.1 gfo/Idh/MocA family oxidoreductase [Maribellus comscasis]
MKRREFIKTSAGAAIGASVLNNPVSASVSKATKRKLVLVGTGVRGTSFWGRNIVQNYGDITEFVGLCDINPGRLELAKEYMGVNCPVYTDFDKMIAETKPDLVVVTTVDATHHEYIIRAMELGVDVLTEKPLTTDEAKAQAIIDTEKKTGRKVIVGFNYRYGTLFSAIKEELAKKPIGEVTSVDFHWYLNTYHGADYFRRWHGERDKSGTLLVHKATHHFDLLNWLIDSDPVEVVAHGALEHYGKNNKFRGLNCRNCAYTDKCKFYWDIKKSERSYKLYVENEKYDGYIRDNCLWREDVDIYDKMAVQIKYANNVQVSYSLTTYSPYEGWRIAFNGKDGRLESWEDIPWRRQDKINQAELHAAEMNQGEDKNTRYDEIFIMNNFNPEYQMKKVVASRGGHGGGDARLQDKIFRDPNMPDPYKHAATSRDGVMSAIIGIAARKSIEEQRVVKIEELTTIKPHPTRNV